MKITAVEAVPVAVPVRRPFVFATGAVERAHHVLVRVRTDEGITGEAEAAPRPMTYGDSQATVVAVIRDLLGPRLIGTDPLAVARVHEALRLVRGNHTATAAIDLAVHDLIGKVLGQPCHVLLGGFAGGVAVSYMLSFGDPEAVADVAGEVSGEYGIGAFKVKVGQGLDRDVAVCAAVRDRLGEAALLYADANQAYDSEDAARLLPALAGLGFAWFEEPSPAAARLAAARLARAAPFSIGGDERCRDLAETAGELLAGTVHRVAVKTARSGFTGSRRILALCDGLGAPVAVGSQFETAIGNLASVAFASAHPSAGSYPVEATSFLDLQDDLVTEPPVVHDGRMAAREAPGLGIQIDEEKLARFRVSLSTPSPRLTGSPSAARAHPPARRPRDGTGPRPRDR